MKGIGRPALALLMPALLAAPASAQVPAAARQFAKAAGIATPITAACRGQFRSGRVGWAVASNNRYMVIDGLGAVVELAAFSDKPDLSCYSRAEALDLNRSIQKSETISGRIAPPFATSIVCAFVDSTTARCWQYSPFGRAYVDVGGWST